MKARKKRRIGKRKEKCRNFLLSLVYLKKTKSKVKDIFFYFGEKLPYSPPTSPNHPYQSQSLLISSIQSFFPQIIFTNSSIVKLHITPIGFWEIYRTNLQKFQLIRKSTYTTILETIYNFINLRVLQKFSSLIGLPSNQHLI